MPDVNELFGKEMTWPRLIVKTGVTGLLTYNFYHYGTVHDTAQQDEPWECFATDFRQPNADGEGENMSAAFEKVIMTGFYVTLAAFIVSVVEIINKFAKNKSLNMLIGILDTLVSLAALGWLIWCYVVRLSRDGKICAGATTNVSAATKPYAYEQGQFLVVMLVLMTILPVTLAVATNCGCL